MKFKKLYESILNEKRGVKKPAPTTNFEISFKELKAVMKAEKKIRSQEAMDEQVKILIDELKTSGYTVLSYEAKLGKFRGSYFITSTPIEIQYEEGKEDTMNQLEVYLKATYSPKFRLKRMNNGIAHFNIR